MAAETLTTSGKPDGEDTDEDKEEIFPKQVAPMFGSLLSVAEMMENTPELVQRLQDNWWQIIRAWYPGMHMRVYSVPPVHFYAVNYKPKVEEPEPEEPYMRFGFRMFLPVQGTNVVDDEAQQRVIRSFYAFAEKKHSVMFILSNVEFQNYLNKDYEFVDKTVKDFEKPQRNEDGEIDVLIIDKQDGIFVLEIKATGYRQDFQNANLEKKLAECINPFMKVSKQLPKEENLVRRLLEDLDPVKKIKIRTGFLMPNLDRNIYEEAISKFPLVTQDLMRATGVASEGDLKKACLCADEMPPKDATITAATMTDEIFQHFDDYWNMLKSIKGGMAQPMEDELYEQIVARFCGPLTTVKIFTEKTMPRVKLETVEVPSAAKKAKGKKNKDKGAPTTKTKIKAPFEARTMAGAAREMARRFSELVLLQEQIELLQRPEDFVHIEGPPGTGKTLMLLLRILTWLDGKNLVYLLSLSPPSRSIIHVLHEQVKRMLFAYKGEEEAKTIMKKKLRIFVMTRPEHTIDDRYFERRLHKWRSRAKLKDSERNWGYPRPPTLPPVEPGRDKKLCLVLDETGMTGKGLEAFFNQVGECYRQECFTSGDFTSGLSVWSASVEKCGRPAYARHPKDEQTDEKFGVFWKLQMPLRCPPSVQRALMLVQPCLDLNNVFGFQRSKVLPHPVNPSKPNGECNQYHADGLPVYLIAHGSHQKADQDIWFCRECGEDLAKFLTEELKIGQGNATPLDDGTALPHRDIPLMNRDVLIVATHKAFDKSLPIGGFFLAMHKKGLKVAVNTIREEGDAALSPDDIILVADITSVHGLERAVVVVIPEHPNPPPKPETADAPEDKDGGGEAMEVGEPPAESPPSAQQDGVSSDSSPEEVEMKLAQEGGGNEEMPAASNEATEKQGKQSAAAEPLEEWVSPSDPMDKPVIDNRTDLEWVYTDNDTESKIDAALQTLTEKAREDIFYIGSRAVCQLILIHHGKG